MYDLIHYRARHRHYSNQWHQCLGLCYGLFTFTNLDSDPEPDSDPIPTVDS